MSVFRAGFSLFRRREKAGLKNKKTTVSFTRETPDFRSSHSFITVSPSVCLSRRLRSRLFAAGHVPEEKSGEAEHIALTFSGCMIQYDCKTVKNKTGGKGHAFTKEEEMELCAFLLWS